MSTKKIIIAGFPGVGKSYAGGTNSAVIDLESSNFHWIEDSNGVKHQHPEWPINYVNAIKIMACESEGLESMKDIRYVLISTHNEILKMLKNSNIPFIIYAPKSKNAALKRYRDRGSSEQFIESLNENWDNYMNDLEQLEMPMIRSDVYLKDALDRRGAYGCMMERINKLK